MKHALRAFILTVIVISFVTSAYGQQEMSKPKSVYEQFLSDLGTMITKDFYALSSLRSSYKNLEVKVIRITSKKGSNYFLSLSATEEYSKKSAIIAHDDLTEISKALNTIITKSKKESTKKLEYRERFFVTNDGFKIGYYQKGTEQTFFIDLDDYQSDDNYFFDNFDPLIQAIERAKAKIESLK
ncbi:MAG TPA: hypothetical protein ENH52_00425 [Nitrospirae bacterium]|nr:hypothetical protein [Nitrospirota bacterium]